MTTVGPPPNDQIRRLGSVCSTADLNSFVDLAAQVATQRRRRVLQTKHSWTQHFGSLSTLLESGSGSFGGSGARHVVPATPEGGPARHECPTAQKSPWIRHARGSGWHHIMIVLTRHMVGETIKRRQSLRLWTCQASGFGAF